MRRIKVVLMGILSCYVGLFFFGCVLPATSEYALWDCTECGRNGNTGQFCGNCGNPAPAIDSESIDQSLPEIRMITQTVPNSTDHRSEKEIDLSGYTLEELTELQEIVYDEIRAKKTLEENSIPSWNGKERILVYEDEYVTISFNGLYAWTEEWFLPKLMITNKTNQEIMFRWENVYFDNITLNPSNGGAVQILPNGKLAFETSHKCSITLQEYVDTYEETVLHLFRLDFSLRSTDNKNLKKGSFSVRCDIPLQ